MDMIKEYFSMEDAFIYLDWHSLVFVLEALLLVWIGKIINDLFIPTYRLNQELLQRDNKALAVSFSGYLGGMGIVMLGVFESESSNPLLSDPFWNDVVSLILWSLVGIVCLNIARWMNDKIILHRFDNTKEIIQDKNVGTGAVQWGSYMGSAFILRAVIASEASEGLLRDIIDTFVYFFITQLFFVLFGKLYQFITQYDFHEEIEKDNVAAGVSYGLTLTSLGIILSYTISRTQSIAAFGIWFINGVILLILSRWLLDKIILPGHRLDREISQDRNWGVALLEGAVAMTVAFLINASFTF